MNWFKSTAGNFYNLDNIARIVISPDRSKCILYFIGGSMQTDTEIKESKDVERLSHYLDNVPFRGDYGK